MNHLLKCLGFFVFLMMSPNFVSAQSVYLISPSNGAADVPIPTLFTWNQTGMEYFWLQVDDNSDFSSPVIDNNSISGTQYTVNSLQQNTVYYWRVNGHVYDQFGGYWRGFTSTWSFTTECPQPGAPIMLEPMNGADEVALPVYFDWEDIFNVYEYEIQIDDNSDFSSVNEGYFTPLSNYTSAGLAENTHYFWRIRARFNNGCSWGNWSATRSLQTECPIPDQTSLIYPANNAVDLDAPLVLDWDDVVLAEYYHVLLDDDPYFGSPEVDYEFPAGFSDFTVTSLDINKSYYWKVSAYNSCGLGLSSQSWHFSTACPTPAAPNPILPIYDAVDLSLPVTFTWSEDPNNIAYRLQVDDELGFGSLLYDILLPPGFTYDMTSFLEQGKSYYWRMRAENACGWSNWSTASTLTMACPTVAMPVLTGPDNGSTNEYLPVILNWDDVVNATGYHVIIDEEPAFGSPLIDYSFPKGTSNFYPEGLSENITYYWKVMAFNDCNESSWSEVNNFQGKNISPCGDVNNDDLINILDIIYTINFIYKEGRPPCETPAN